VTVRRVEHIESSNLFCFGHVCIEWSCLKNLVVKLCPRLVSSHVEIEENAQFIGGIVQGQKLEFLFVQIIKSSIRELSRNMFGCIGKIPSTK
jgi:hypothetical protein